MKYLIYLLFPFLTFSQEKAIEITYKVIYNTEVPNTKNGYLYVSSNQKKTVYFIKDIKKIEKTKNLEADATVILDSGEKRFNYFDYEKDSILTKEDILGSSNLIKEKIPVITWKLLKETKTLDNTTLYKATCYFRGRNYIAWYATDTAIKAGPWKFHGLPGLIYEISDETQRYNWVLQKIKGTDFNFQSNDFDLNNKQIITLKEYAKLKFNYNNLNKKLLARLPRNAKIKNPRTFRTGFEIKFEWEEEAKKD